jgi:4-amino-4-deoxy-L-arabinose transferase-like glycosyltransferase
MRSGKLSPNLRTGILFLFFGLLAAKAIAAANMNLFGDEAFYFQCARRLYVCYCDHPFMTALLVRLGTIVAGDTTLGVRLMFLVVGLGIPLGVFWLARPLVGRRDAWLAMGASLLVPTLGLISTVAVPDVPLLALSVLSLAAFERATRKGGTLRWLLAGMLTALGLSTHYRFALFPCAAFLYLVGTLHGRSCLRKPGPWLGSVAMCTGFLPALLFNLQQNWAPIKFQGIARHNAGFDFENILMHLPEQLATVSPLFYIALLFVLVVMWRRAINGDDRSALLAIFSSTFLGVYFFLSPWSDSSNAHMHWPLPGYLPLLVLLPATIRSFLGRQPTVARTSMAMMVPGLGGMLILLILSDVSFGVLEMRFLHSPFIGWEKGSQQALTYVQKFEDSLGSPAIVVSDNYILAGQSEFFLPDNVAVYTLDNYRRNQRHGRSLQYRIWNLGEEGLRGNAGKNALIIVEKAATAKRNRNAWMLHIKSFFESVEYIGELEVPGVKNKTRCFDYYLGRNILS